MNVSPDGSAETIAKIAMAVQEAEWAGAISRAHAEAIRAALSPSAAAAAAAATDTDTATAKAAAAAKPAQAEYALALPNPAAVSLPMSSRVALRFGVQRVQLLRQHVDSGKAGLELTTTEGKFLAGFTCEDLYNMGYTKASLSLTQRVLLGEGRLGCWPLGQLTLCFGFTADEMLRALGLWRLDSALPPEQLALLEQLLCSSQSAESYHAAGVTAEMLAGLGCTIRMLQCMPFGLKDIVTYMGLTYAVARKMGLDATTCGAKGWSCVSVRGALQLSDQQAKESGLTVSQFLVVPGLR
jgi:hypothetical protein